MKIAFVFLGLLIVSLVSCGCKSSKDCTERDTPQCDGENCVECIQHSDCAFNKYCKEKDHTCRKYSEDDKLGEFCNSEFCQDYDTHIVCGKCTNSTTTIWTGSCINFKCEACSTLADGSIENTIYNQHKDLAMCVPKGVSGHAGSLTTYQQASGVPGFFLQTSMSLGFFVVGFFIFASLIVECLILKRASD